MTETQRLLAIGAYVNSALYCAGVFVAGMLTANALAWRLALMTVGANFLCYLLQLHARDFQPWVPALASVMTIVLGILAGVALL